jgi:hypothetical protein
MQQSMIILKHPIRGGSAPGLTVSWPVTNMATVINMAMLYCLQHEPGMNHPDFSGKSSQAQRWQVAADHLKLIFGEADWKVNGIDQHQPAGKFRARRRKVEYSVELKAASEGRADRLIPLFAQAALQLMHDGSLRRNELRLAVVSAPRIPPRAAEQVLEFASQYAPDVAVGLFDFEGLRLFRGPGLEDLNRRARAAASRVSALRSAPRVAPPFLGPEPVAAQSAAGPGASGASALCTSRAVRQCLASSPGPPRVGDERLPFRSATSGRGLPPRSIAVAGARAT